MGACDVAQSGAFDRISIDDHERDATWRIVDVWSGMKYQPSMFT